MGATSIVNHIKNGYHIDNQSRQTRAPYQRLATLVSNILASKLADKHIIPIHDHVGQLGSICIFSL